MPEWDSENLSAPHTQREIDQIGERPAASVMPRAGLSRAAVERQVRLAVEVLSAAPAASARFVVDYMERETGLPFGDMIGRADAEEILARAGRKAGDGLAAFRKITWPVCSDCFRHIEPGTTEGHLPWCPYAGALDFPRHEA